MNNISSSQTFMWLETNIDYANCLSFHTGLCRRNWTTLDLTDEKKMTILFPLQHETRKLIRKHFAKVKSSLIMKTILQTPFFFACEIIINIYLFFKLFLQALLL
jgi:hypothetical protein